MTGNLVAAIAGVGTMLCVLVGVFWLIRKNPIPLSSGKQAATRAVQKTAIIGFAIEFVLVGVVYAINPALTTTPGFYLGVGCFVIVLVFMLTVVSRHTTNLK